MTTIKNLLRRFDAYTLEVFTPRAGLGRRLPIERPAGSPGTR